MCLLRGMYVEPYYNINKNKNVDLNDICDTYLGQSK